jgi:hypothetical protein
MGLAQGELLGFITWFSNISPTCYSTTGRSAFGKRQGNCFIGTVL